MARRGKNLTWCEREIVRMPCFLAFCCSENEYMREMKRRGIPPADIPAFPKWPTSAKVSFFSSNGEPDIALVCLDPSQAKTRGLSDTMALLVHEAAHVWQHTRRELGEHEPSPEFEAYSMQSISQELFDAFFGWMRRTGFTFDTP